MAVEIRGKADTLLNQFAGVMGKLVEDFPQADVTIRRTDVGMVRVRVIDSAFRRLSETRRENRVWKYLEQLPPDVLTFTSMVLTFTPDEAKTSPLNHDFEHPIRMHA